MTKARQFLDSTVADLGELPRNPLGKVIGKFSKCFYCNNPAEGIKKIDGTVRPVCSKHKA